MELSKEFRDSIITGVAPSATCPFCKRLNFASRDPQMYDDGDLGALENLTREKPNSCVEHQDKDVLEIGVLEGKTVVLDCPCERLINFENTIWANRHTILSYLSKRANSQLIDAQKTMGVAASVAANL